MFSNEVGKFAKTRESASKRDFKRQQSSKKVSEILTRSKSSEIYF